MKSLEIDGCDERKIKAWRDGIYVYCLSHGTSQVIDWEYVYEGDDSIWIGRQCDWCSSKLR